MGGTNLESTASGTAEISLTHFLAVWGAFLQQDEQVNYLSKRFCKRNSTKVRFPYFAARACVFLPPFFFILFTSVPTGKLVPNTPQTRSILLVLIDDVSFLAPPAPRDRSAPPPTPPPPNHPSATPRKPQYGWNNFGPHAHSQPNAAEIQTPVMDQLVAEGVLLDRH